MLEAATSLIPSETLESVRESALDFSAALTKAGLMLSADEVSHIVLAIQCNAHSIKISSGDVIGVGLFPTVSMMNHSCIPNCAHTFSVSQFSPVRLEMRAIRDITAGEELCYSYVPLYQSTEKRRAQLSAAYSFICCCERCTNSEGTFLTDDVLSGTKGDEKSNELFKKTEKEIQTCVSLIEKGSNIQNLRFLKKILSALSILKTSELVDPAHHSLLQAYICICETGISLWKNNRNAKSGRAEEIMGDDDMLAISFSFGALAIGCISAYTCVQSADIGKLAGNLALSVSIMVSESTRNPEYRYNVLHTNFPLVVLKEHLGDMGDSIARYIECFSRETDRYLSVPHKTFSYNQIVPQANGFIEMAASNYLTERGVSDVSQLTRSIAEEIWQYQSPPFEMLSSNPLAK